MSKKLTKIVAISLLSLIVPVAVVVTAVCLSTAVTYSVTIDTKGFENVGAITYKVNGKDYEEGMRFKKGSTVVVTANTTGYDFKGWYDCAIGAITADKEVVEKESTYTFEIQRDTMITAQSDIIVYSVSYDGVASVSLKYGEDLKDTTALAIPTGKYFAGWKLDVNNDGALSGDELTAGYSAKAIFDKKEVALIASIEDICYNVSYKGAEGSSKLVWGADLAEGSVVTAPAGHHFTKWMLDDKAFTKAEFDAKYMNSDVELVPAFELNKYMVKYDEAEAVEVTYGEALASTLQTAAAGKYFAGWTMAGDEKVYTVADFTQANGADIELSTKFYDIYYMVSFDGAEAVKVMYNTELTTVEKAADEDKANGIVFDTWKLGEADVDNATFDAETYMNGKEVVRLTSVQKDLYEINDSYKLVKFGKLEYNTGDVGLLAMAENDPNEMILDKNTWINEIQENESVKINFKEKKISVLYNYFINVYQKGSSEKYTLKKIEVRYEANDGTQHSVYLDYTDALTVDSIIKEFLKLTKDANEEITSRVLPLEISLNFIYARA